MDELQTLRAFRSEIQGASLEDPVREQTLRTLRTLTDAEAARSDARPVRRPGRTRPASFANRRRSRLAAVVLAAAVIAAVIAFLPPRGTSRSLVGQALAAVGSGSVLHVVAEMPTGTQILNLSSGQVTPVLQHEEIWYDNEQGLRRDITRIDGAIVDDSFENLEGGWTPHGVIYDCTWIAAHPQAATRARVSCNPSGDNGTTPRVVPRPKPTLDPGLTGFVDSYRDALASGAAREDGTGTIEGRSVDWLVFQTHDGPERIALDAQTHKPVQISGPRGFERQIRTIEALDSADGKFARPAPSETPIEPSRGSAESDQELAPTSEAIAAGYHGAVWAGLSVHGVPLASATTEKLAVSYARLKPQKTGSGLKLQYGTLDQHGHRDLSKPYVVIYEAADPELAFAATFSPLRGGTLHPGSLYMERGSRGIAIGALTVDGQTVALQASSDELLVAAARALQLTQ